MCSLMEGLLSPHFTGNEEVEYIFPDFKELIVHQRTKGKDTKIAALQSRSDLV